MFRNKYLVSYFTSDFDANIISFNVGRLNDKIGRTIDWRQFQTFSNNIHRRNIEVSAVH